MKLPTSVRDSLGRAHVAAVVEAMTKTADNSGRLHDGVSSSAEKPSRAAGHAAVIADRALHRGASFPSCRTFLHLRAHGAIVSIACPCSALACSDSSRGSIPGPPLKSALAYAVTGGSRRRGAFVIARLNLVRRFSKGETSSSPRRSRRPDRASADVRRLRASICFLPRWTRRSSLLAQVSTTSPRHSDPALASPTIQAIGFRPVACPLIECLHRGEVQKLNRPSGSTPPGMGRALIANRGSTRRRALPSSPSTRSASTTPNGSTRPCAELRSGSNPHTRARATGGLDDTFVFYKSWLSSRLVAYSAYA